MMTTDKGGGALFTFVGFALEGTTMSITDSFFGYNFGARAPLNCPHSRWAAGLIWTAARSLIAAAEGAGLVIESWDYSFSVHNGVSIQNTTFKRNQAYGALLSHGSLLFSATCCVLAISAGDGASGAGALLTLSGEVHNGVLIEGWVFDDNTATSASLALSLCVCPLPCINSTLGPQSLAAGLR